MDSKLIYIAKTLSRTSRKDYENYVVNAIWNRVSNQNLVPVSQHFVKSNSGDYYYIDLYFPQLNIGIECDEAHHKAQKIADAERTYSIRDVLWQGGGNGFSEIRIDITKNYEEVAAQINDAVNFINSQIDAVGLDNGWELFDPDPKAYYQNKKAIRISDNIVFRTNNDVCNIVLGKNYNGNQQQMILLSEGLYAWLPTKMDVNRPNSKGYSNKISKDGTQIFETTSDPKAMSERVLNQKHIGEKELKLQKILKIIAIFFLRMPITEEVM